MSDAPNNHGARRDPLGLNWELRQVLSSPALPERVDDPDSLDATSLPALFHLAEVLGECRLFEVDIDPSLDGTLSLKMALAVQREATREAAAILRTFDELRVERERREAPHDSNVHDLRDIEYEESSIQLTERQLSLVAVREALNEAYYASVGDDPELVERMRNEIDRYFDIREQLDRTMSEHMEVLLPVRRTNLLSNWFAMLREEYKLLAEQWWFFDEERWREAELRAATELNPIGSPQERATPDGIAEGNANEPGVVARLVEAVWRLADPNARRHEFALAAHGDAAPPASLQHAFRRVASIALPHGSIEATIQLNSRWQAEVFLSGLENAIDDIVGMTLGEHNLTKGKVPFHWVGHLDQHRYASAHETLLALPLMILSTDGSRCVVRGGLP